MMRKAVSTASICVLASLWHIAASLPAEFDMARKHSGQFLDVAYFAEGTVSSSDDGEDEEIMHGAGGGELNQFIFFVGPDSNVFYFQGGCQSTGQTVDFARERLGGEAEINGGPVSFDLACERTDRHGFTFKVTANGTLEVRDMDGIMRFSIAQEVAAEMSSDGKLEFERTERSRSSFSIKFRPSEPLNKRTRCDVLDGDVSRKSTTVYYREDGGKSGSTVVQDKKLTEQDGCVLRQIFR